MSTLQRRNRQRGKANQKVLASILDGDNLGTLGGVDVRVEEYYIEAKSFKEDKIPKWFKDIWEQAVFHTKRGGVPVVQIHKYKDRHDEDWIVLPLWKFKELIGEEYGKEIKDGGDPYGREHNAVA